MLIRLRVQYVWCEPNELSAFTVVLQVEGQQQALGGRLVTKKFTLRQNFNASGSLTAKEQSQLVCRGRGYDLDSSTSATVRRPFSDVQSSHTATKGLLTSKTSSSTSGKDTVASRTPIDGGRSQAYSPQLARSINVRQVQPRRWIASKSTSSTVINSSPDPAGCMTNTPLTISQSIDGHVGPLSDRPSVRLY